ncbi:Endonuclease/Exonuclease/phosphatase_family protein [Hexamita inflata]|nr:Endonuclease/Exonuclease/phosphatase family protein [Hexamita inflata]
MQEWVVQKTSPGLRIVSFNIDGLTINYDQKVKMFYYLLKNEDPDIICLQETKCSSSELSEVVKEVFEGYKLYYSSAKYYPQDQMSGYQFGTAILIKNHINANYIDFQRYIPIQNQFSSISQQIKEEGRITMTQIGPVILINVYVPFSRTRSEFRKQFDDFFRNYIKQIQQQQSLIIMGDFNSTNIVYKEQVPGCSEFEVQNFHKLINECKLTEVKIDGLTVFGSQHASQIDHILIRNIKFDNERVLTNYYGSDHAPIVVDVRK